MGRYAGPFLVYPTNAAPIAAAPGGGLKVSSISCVYTPGDTNSHTYKLQAKVSSGGGTYSFRVNGLKGADTYGATSSITLMEVAG